MRTAGIIQDCPGNQDIGSPLLYTTIKNLLEGRRTRGKEGKKIKKKNKRIRVTERKGKSGGKV